MRRCLLAAALAALAAAAPAPAARRTCVYRPPARLEAVFEQPSYAAGGVATLAIRAQTPLLDVQLLRAAPEVTPNDRDDFVDGVPISPDRSYVWGPDQRDVFVPLDADWPSGVYFARVTAADGTVAFAPLVLRPAQLGQVRVAVVIPTYTWQAYDFRGYGSWYTCPRLSSVDLGRPYLDRGVPPHYRDYDAQFIQWLTFTGKRVDYLADQDLDRLSGTQLRSLYDLVVFEGHEEYVTTHEYGAVERYRNLGGNLMFLSANSFFRHVVIRGRRMTLIGLWRDEGRPEAALVGEEYAGRNPRYPNRPYRIVGARRVPWLFADTGLWNGDLIHGAFGIEIDAVAPSSPPGTIVVARIRDIFPGETAEMTYYETARGARVFAAGTMGFGGWAEIQPVTQLLENLWAHLTTS